VVGNTVTVMKILHTSDWHLGRSLHGVDMHEHQRAFIDHVVDQVKAHQVDAVLISGDVYDRAIPAVPTVRLFNQALSALAEVTRVIITPGNHDSAVRLGFASDLMRSSVRIAAGLQDITRPVVLEGPHADVAVYTIGYLDPDTTRAALSDHPDEPLARSHEAVLGEAMRRVREDLATRQADRERAGRRPLRSVVMAHAFVVGGSGSDSERDLSVGGVDSVPSAVFDGVDYVALGHLHGAQQISVPGSTTIARYCGSPLAYSFSEKNHVKGTLLVQFDGVEVPSVQLLEAPVPRRLTELRGTLAEVLDDETVAAHRDDWLKVSVTDPSYPALMHEQVRAAYPHVLAVTHDPQGGDQTSRAPIVTDAMSAPAVTGQFLAYVTGEEPTQAEQAVIERAYDLAKAERS
jgi:exonuclease SbcD